MTMYHAFVKREGENAPRLWLRDQTAGQIRAKLVKPYRKGSALVEGGSIIPVSTLREVRIVQTDGPFDATYEVAFHANSQRMDELNRGSNVFFASVGPGHDDMVTEWPDVTDEFMNGAPPGSGDFLGVIAKITNHQLVVGVVVAVVAAFLAWLGLR